MRAILVLLAVGSAVAKPPPSGKNDPSSILFLTKQEPRSDLACGSHTLTEGTYTISSPNYPSNYDNNYDCTYSLTPGSGVAVFRVQCSAFNLESQSSCRYDYLQVGGEKFCGTTGPSATRVGPTDITFHSDYSVTRTGFQCTITAQAGSTAQELACGRTTVEPGLYSIKSPNYPNNYDNNFDCTYTINPGSGVNTMTLACCDFSVESHSSCGWDWLQVNGEKFCGRQGPALTETGAFNIDFHTDYSVVRGGFYCEVRATP